MSRPPWNELSAVALRAALQQGEVTCEQVAQACIDRITARDGAIKAWSHFDAATVLAQARKLDSAAVRGSMHGIPVGVKDVIDTYDMPTQMGSPIYRGYQPRSDASCVALLRAAGALILGKTVTCEFAGPAPAQTTNPHDTSRTPGGSSSGSGAAVADYMVPLAFGTQTGGSIQRPSSFCGIVGYKPTFGAINTAGVKPAAESLDTVGLMARTVEDIELAARVLTNSTEVAWLPAQTKVRIGVCRTHAWDSAEDASKQALLNAAQRLGAQGHTVKEVTLPESFNELVTTREIVNDYERARGMAHEWQSNPGLISPALAKSIRNGLTISADRYTEAQRHIEDCRRLLQPFFTQFDVLLAPTVPGEAPTGLAFTGDHKFQSIWTQLRTPTVNLPTHAGPNGLPVGIQLVGQPYQDSALLAIARLVFGCLGRGPTVNTGTHSADVAQ